MWVNDYGQGEINTDDFYTRKNAETYCKDLKEDFKEHDYYVEEYEKVIRKSYAYPNSIDGWEDLYPR